MPSAISACWLTPRSLASCLSCLSAAASCHVVPISSYVAAALLTCVDERRAGRRRCHHTQGPDLPTEYPENPAPKLVGVWDPLTRSGRRHGGYNRTTIIHECLRAGRRHGGSREHHRWLCRLLWRDRQQRSRKTSVGPVKIVTGRVHHLICRDASSDIPSVLLCGSSRAALARDLSKGVDKMIGVLFSCAAAITMSVARLRSDRSRDGMHPTSIMRRCSSDVAHATHSAMGACG
jgi:hypothetical protein